MLLEDIKATLAHSLKAGDRRRVETLRFLMAAIHNAAIAKYGAESEIKLTETDVLETIKKQVKSHKQSIEAFEKAGRTDLVTKEKEELAILEAYQAS